MRKRDSQFLTGESRISPLEVIAEKTFKNSVPGTAYLWLASQEMAIMIYDVKRKSAFK